MVDLSSIFIGFKKKSNYNQKKSVVSEEYYINERGYPHIIVGNDTMTIYNGYNRKILIYSGKVLNVECILRILNTNIKNWQFIYEAMQLRIDIEALIKNDENKSDIRDLRLLLKMYEMELKK